MESLEPVWAALSIIINTILKRFMFSHIFSYFLKTVEKYSSKTTKTMQFLQVSKNNPIKQNRAAHTD